VGRSRAVWTQTFLRRGAIASEAETMFVWDRSDVSCDSDGTDLRALPRDVEISHRLRRLLNPPRPA
jgi:hypothetical protein